MSTITIISPAELRRDEEDLGAVFDAIANHDLHLPDVQRAFEAFLSAKDKSAADAATAKDAEHAAAMESAQTTHADAIAKLTAERDTALAYASEVPALRAEIEALTPKPNALIDRMEAAFATLPDDVRATFAIPAGAVGFYLTRGNLEMAKLTLASVQVPPELEATRDSFAALLGA